MELIVKPKIDIAFKKLFADNEELLTPHRYRYSVIGGSSLTPFGASERAKRREQRQLLLTFPMRPLDLYKAHFATSSLGSMSYTRALSEQPKTGNALNLLKNRSNLNESNQQGYNTREVANCA